MVKLLNTKLLDFVLVEQHVWNAIIDWEFSTRFWAHQISIDDVDLQQNVVSLLQKVLIVLIVVHQLGRHVAQLAQLTGSLDHFGPVQFGDDSGNKLGAELYLTHFYIFGLNVKWVSNFDALDAFRAEHVVRQQLHGQVFGETNFGFLDCTRSTNLQMEKNYTLQVLLLLLIFAAL